TKNPEWQIVYDTAGGNTIANGTDTIVTDTSAVLQNLMPETQYEVFVREICSASDSSDYAGPVTFTTPPTCISPTALSVDTITTDSARISWSSQDTGAQWQVVYATTGGNTIANGTREFVADTSAVLTGLSSATSYVFFVREVWAMNDTSSFSGPGSFTTDCPAFTAQYTQNWDSAAAQSPLGDLLCWSTAGNESSQIDLDANSTIDTELPPTLPNEVTFNDADLTAGDTSILVSPRFSDLGAYDKRVRVQVAFDNQADSRLFIGVMSNQSDVSSFVPLDTLTNPSSVTEGEYAEYIVNLDDTAAIGSREYVALANGDDTYETTVDLLNYEQIPACPLPSNLSASNVTTTDADISWTQGPQSSGDYVVYVEGPSGDTLAANGSSTTVSGLAPETSYNVYLDEICSSGDTSNRIGPVTLTTLSTCPAPDSLNITNVTADSIDVSWSTGDSSQVNHIVYVQGPSGDTVTVSGDSTTVTGLAVNTDYDVFVREVCSANDSSALVGPVSIKTLCNPLSIPYTQNFDGITPNLPNCWNANDGTNEIFTATGCSNTGAHLQINGIPDNFVRSPRFSVSGQPSIKVGYDIRGGCGNDPESQDSLRVEYWDGNQWTPLAFYDGNTVSLSTFRADSFIITNGLTDDFSVRFYMISGSGSGFDDYDIENFFIDTLDPCTEPLALQTDSIGANAATVSWTPLTNNTEWLVTYDTIGGNTLQNGATISVTDTFTTLTGLMPKTDYEFYVREVCANDTTANAGPVQFTTTPTCIAPTNLQLSNITPTSADITWSSGPVSEIDHVIYVQGPGGDTIAAGNVDSINISGLMSQTSYDVFAREVCSQSDSSVIVGPVSFTTICTPFTATYTHSFDSVTAPALDSCWSVFEVGQAENSGTRTSATADGGTVPPSSPNLFELNDGDTTMLISPSLSDLPTYQNRVRFKASDEDGVGAELIYVGVMADPNDATTFVPIDTVDPPNGAFTEFTVNLNDTSSVGNNQYVALKHAQAGNFEIFIDDFVYEPLPSCLKPKNVQTTAQFGSAFINWTAGQSGSLGWEIVYGPAGSNPLTNGTVVTTTNTADTLNNLMLATDYQAYVREICAPGDTSAYTGPISFRTIDPNPSACNVGVPIPDAGCASGDSAVFPVKVQNAPGSALGDDVVLTDADIIIEHSYDADLNIRLRSPSGQMIELSTNNGFSSDDYGDPSNCPADVTNFNMNAGTNITAGSAPFIGSYVPEGNFASFEDSTNPNGIWELVVCDDVGGISGTIEYFGLEFKDIDSTNLGVTSILEPSLGACGDSSQNVELVVENFGVGVQDSIPASVDITGIITTSFTGMINDSLMPGAVDTVTVGSVNTFAGGPINLTAYTQKAADGYTPDDTTKKSVNINPIPTVTTSNDTGCIGESLTLTASSTTQNFEWYATATSDSVISEDDTLVTSGLQSTQSFYVTSYQSTKDRLGPANNNFGTTSTVSSQLNQNSMFISVDRNVMLDSLTVYAAGAGDFVFFVTDSPQTQVILRDTLTVQS
ncbi:MAG: hypothetical protein BRD50_02860, partial [Bacteroidetes bacterium SW_11_45_7]